MDSTAPLEADALAPVVTRRASQAGALAPISAAAVIGRPRVVILGAGFGGLYAAKALRKADADVFVVDRRNHHLFQPLLYQVATAALNASDIAEPIRRVLRRQRNTEVVLAEARGIDPMRKCVVLQGAELAYDY